MKTNNKKELCIDILVDIAAGVLIALGTYNFATAAKFPMSGFNGIGLIFYHLWGLPIGIVALVLNIPVAIACYKTLGRHFMLRSIRSILITSLIMDYVAPLFPLYTGEKILAMVCTAVLSGLGYAMIFMRDSSTGGTDFILLSIKAKKPHLTLGSISFAMESIVVLIGTVLVSKDIDGLIYGLIINFILSAVMDKFMYGISSGKLALIVTDRADTIAPLIEQTTGRGCTFLKAEGSYSKKDKDVIMCASSRKEMYGVRKAVKKIDPNALLSSSSRTKPWAKDFRRTSSTLLNAAKIDIMSLSQRSPSRKARAELMKDRCTSEGDRRAVRRRRSRSASVPMSLSQRSPSRRFAF